MADETRLERGAKAVNQVVTAVMGFAILIGTFLFFFALLFKGAVEGISRDIVLFILGALSSNMTQVISFYFGSSKGSEEKTKALRESIQNGTKK